MKDKKECRIICHIALATLERFTYLPISTLPRNIDVKINIVSIVSFNIEEKPLMEKVKQF